MNAEETELFLIEYVWSFMTNHFLRHHIDARFGMTHSGIKISFEFLKSLASYRETMYLQIST